MVNFVPYAKMPSIKAGKQFSFVIKGVIYLHWRESL